MPGVHIQNFCLDGFTLSTFALEEPGRRDLTAYFASARKDIAVTLFASKGGTHFASKTFGL